MGKEILNVCQTYGYKFLVLSLKYPLEYMVHEYLIACLCGLARFSEILFGEVKVETECEDPLRMPGAIQHVNCIGCKVSSFCSLRDSSFS